MGRKKHTIFLTQEEHEYLQKNTTSGTWRPRKLKRALILLKADSAKNKEIDEEEIAKQLNCCKATVINVRLRFDSGERLQALEDKPRIGRPKIVDGEAELIL